MKYIGIPLGMWVLFEKSFRKNLVSEFGYNKITAKQISKNAKSTIPSDASIFSSQLKSFKSVAMFISRSPAGSSWFRTAITSGKSRL